MRIIRYYNTPVFSPAADFPGLRDEMDRLFAAFPTLGYQVPREFPIDLYRDKEAFVVRAELPGFRKEDLSIDVADGVLTVTAHRKVETNAEQAAENAPKTTSERRISRSISLPEHVNVAAIGAKYENGVLTVTLPKQEEVKPKQIAIEVK